MMRPLHELILEATARQGSGFTSRRGVLALAGAAAAAPTVVGLEIALAKKNKGKNNKNKNKNKNKDKDKDLKGDIAVLNYALTLEHLEYAFYRDGLAQFVAGDFDPGVFNRLQDIREHEDAHVDTLIDVISGLGGDPVEELCYDFGYDNAGEFLDVAQLLENTGVMAYTGAIATIKAGDLQTAGATIATVEAWRASYLNLINGDDPFPDDFDIPKSQEEILAAAGGFIIDCP